VVCIRLVCCSVYKGSGSCKNSSDRGTLDSGLLVFLLGGFVLTEVRPQLKATSKHGQSVYISGRFRHCQAHFLTWQNLQKADLVLVLQVVYTYFFGRCRVFAKYSYRTPKDRMIKGGLIVVHIVVNETSMCSFN